MSFLKKLFGSKSRNQRGTIVRNLRDLGKKYPALGQFVKPLADSIETGFDPEGGKTDYREVASLIEGVVINVARNQGHSGAIPSLRKIAKLLNDLAENDAGSALGLAMKGQLLVDQEKFDEAIEVLNKALEIDPRKGDARYNLGVAYMKKVLKAEMRGSRALTPKMATAEKQWKKELLDKAEECWVQVLQQDPQHSRVADALSQLRSYRMQHG